MILPGRVAILGGELAAATMVVARLRRVMLPERFADLALLALGGAVALGVYVLALRVVSGEQCRSTHGTHEGSIRLATNGPLHLSPGAGDDP